MNLTRWILLGAAVGLLTHTAATAYAQPDPAKMEERRKKADEAKAARREARDEAKEERDKVREERREKRDEVVAKRRALVDAYVAGATPEEIQKASDELIAARKDLQKARKETRAAAAARLNAALAEAGVNVSQAALTAELRIHSMRVAKLARIRELAIAANDTALQQRVDQLAAKEDARHKRRMAKLMGGETAGAEGGAP